MGVHGVGRRVSVESLAIDASIWMVQFMKATRDEKGRDGPERALARICKLLYLRTKPVFVFDGGTPVYEEYYYEEFREIGIANIYLK